MLKIQSIIIILWILIASLCSYFIIHENAIVLNYSELKKILETQNITEILVDSEYSYFYEQQGHIYKILTQSLFITQVTKTDYSIDDKSHIDNTEQQQSTFLNLPFQNMPIISSKTSLTLKIFCAVVIILLGIVIILSLSEEYFNKKNKKDNDSDDDNMLQFSTNSHTESNEMSLHITPIKSSVRFHNVAGISDVKDDLLEIIDYLKNPKKYQDLGIYLPKGVLLIGPPGVGKTMIAKAIAGESGVPFFYQSGSSFVQMYVGVGAQRVRDLFAKARANAPAIIFIDEIDAVGKARGGDNNHEWESTLNELLTEMDGFSEQSGVIVIAATNQAEVIDQALLRSGRFDRRIYVDLPDLAEREEILRVHLKNRPHKLNLHEVAKLCIGFSGANIASLVNEAAINALRHQRQEIIMQDILDTADKVLFGKKRQNTLNTQQKEIMAIYNAGKAISQYWLLHDFEKISLMHNAPLENKVAEYSLKSELISQIKIALSGNLALEANDLEASTIAKQDISFAKYIAQKMCEEYGMAERLITDIDDILEILELALQEHREFIYSNKHNIIKIAALLKEKEKLNKEEIKEVLEAQ